MRAVDGTSFKNITSTPATFTLDGGVYGVDFIATWGGGSVTLNKLAADGSTFVAALPAFTANGTMLAELPRGSYQFAVATATAVYLCISRIPGD